MLLQNIFANTHYGNSLFNAEEIAAIEQLITSREVKGKTTAMISCLIRKKELRLTPEEVVRQLYVYRLINSYGYPPNRIQVEFPVNFGREIKRADIVILKLH